MSESVEGILQDDGASIPLPWEEPANASHSKKLSLIPSQNSP